MRQQVYAHHAHRPGYKIVPRSPSYVADMAQAKFCLAPTGGGHGKRQVGACFLGGGCFGGNVLRGVDHMGVGVKEGRGGGGEGRALRVKWKLR